MKKLPQLADVASDAQNQAPLVTVTINRDAAARFGIQPQVIDATLNDAFGQAPGDAILHQQFLLS